MIYQIKKFLLSKHSILNEDFHIQKKENDLYCLKMKEIRN